MSIRGSQNISSDNLPLKDLVDQSGANAAGVEIVAVLELPMCPPRGTGESYLASPARGGDLQTR